MSQNNESVTEDGTKGKEKAKASRHTKKNDDSKVELRGATQEPGNNVHCCINERQAEFHTKTTECIADCVGRECNEDMRKSVNDGKVLNLMEPREPEGKETTHKIKKCEKDLARHCEKMDECNEHKE